MDFYRGRQLSVRGIALWRREKTYRPWVREGRRSVAVMRHYYIAELLALPRTKQRCRAREVMHRIPALVHHARMHLGERGQVC